jgi:dienelactone hydrolase
VRELSQALSLYAARNWCGRPERYHRAPPAIERARVDDAGWPWKQYVHLRFESTYEPHLGEPGRQRWLDYRANRTAHAWLLEHRDRPRPWIVCVPGYRMGHPTVDLTAFRARQLHREFGINVAIPVLPFHGPRRVFGRSGDGFLTGDFVDTLHAQAQAVWDVRRLVGWLRRRTRRPIGVHGISLGAYTAALVASLEEGLACVIAGIPAADIPRLLRGHLPPLVTQNAKRLGFPLEKIDRLMSVVSPLALSPRVPRERRFLYAGLADAVAPPDQAGDLWQHWERPRAEWYHGSHISFAWESGVRKLVREALESSGLVADSPECAITRPTITRPCGSSS